MTLNEAIFQVITHQYKKECEEAHAIVKAAGYTITKQYGCFYVRNPKTHKYVAFEPHVGNYYAYYELVWPTALHTRKYDSIPESMAFNFVAMLNTPYNRAWSDLQYERESLALCKYHNIRVTKYEIANSESRIKELKKKIGALQEEMLREMESKVNHTNELRNYRIEYKLKGGR